MQSCHAEVVKNSTSVRKRGTSPGASYSAWLHRCTADLSDLKTQLNHLLDLPSLACRRQAAAAVESFMLLQEGTGPGAFDAAWLQRFMAELSDFEKQMNQVAIDSGILTGVPTDSLSAAGELASSSCCMRSRCCTVRSRVRSCTLSGGCAHQLAHVMQDTSSSCVL